MMRFSPHDCRYSSRCVQYFLSLQTAHIPVGVFNISYPYRLPIFQSVCSTFLVQTDCQYSSRCVQHFLSLQTANIPVGVFNISCPNRLPIFQSVCSTFHFLTDCQYSSRCVQHYLSLQIANIPVSVFNISCPYRLPIFQSVCSTFLVPLMAMRAAGKWTCDNVPSKKNKTHLFLSVVCSSEVLSDKWD